MFLSLLDENGMAKKTYPTKRAEVPATQGQLHEVRDELKADIRAVEESLKSEIHGVRSEVHGLKSEIHGIKSEVHGLRAMIEKMDSRIHAMMGLMELQHAENRAALEGYNHVSQEVAELRKRFDDFENGT
jgi:chromosome segregation ATPase